MTSHTPETIRAAQAEHAKLRERDLADKLGVTEVQLVAAQAGMRAIRIDAHPDTVMGLATQLGEVMALTRNISCVHEKIGIYDNYHTGSHAAMVLTKDIDLRLFPSHWKHAFLVEKETGDAVRRSVQVFDAAGDAIHKIFVREETGFKAWDTARAELPLAEQAETVAVADRVPPEVPKAVPEKVDILRKEWTRMTDTHQFMRLTSKLKMNRLGAYRIAGAPFVRPLATSGVDDALQALSGSGIEVMVFTGNKGCIQIHNGPIDKLKAMGPWQNVLDPGFNLHLRLDHIAEVWAVDKPTQRGPAISVEAFDDKGSLILQVFGVGKESNDHRPAWKEIVAALPTLPETQPA